MTVPTVNEPSTPRCSPIPQLLPKFKKLASFFKLSATGVLDELLSFRTDLSEEQPPKTLKWLYEDGSCSTFQQLTELVESCLLVSTHNMIVESGLSLMKTIETSYQSNMTTETYDALRTIQDFWDVEDFEEIEITSELESSVASASERYREVTKEKQVLNSRKRTYAEELRTEVQVFKRKSTLTVWREITVTNNELEQARKLVFDLESRKAMLMKERDAPSTWFLWVPKASVIMSVIMYSV